MWYLAVIGGSSTLLLGVGPLEDEGGGHEVLMRTGDVIVTPAGVAHVSKDSHDGYRYVGVYPKVRKLPLSLSQLSQIPWLTPRLVRALGLCQVEERVLSGRGQVRIA